MYYVNVIRGVPISLQDFNIQKLRNKTDVGTRKNDGSL